MVNIFVWVRFVLLMVFFMMKVIFVLIFGWIKCFLGIVVLLLKVMLLNRMLLFGMLIFSVYCIVLEVRLIF